MKCDKKFVFFLAKHGCPKQFRVVKKNTLQTKIKSAKSIYRVSQEECARLRVSVPYVKVYRYNPKHLYPKLSGYGDNGQRSLKF